MPASNRSLPAACAHWHTPVAQRLCCLCKTLLHLLLLHLAPDQVPLPTGDPAGFELSLAADLRQVAQRGLGLALEEVEAEGSEEEEEGEQVGGCCLSSNSIGAARRQCLQQLLHTTQQ
jgi:hypothetical protein